MGGEAHGVIGLYQRLSEPVRWILFVPVSLALSAMISLVVGALLINTAVFSLLVAFAETIVSHLTLIGLLYITIPRGKPVVARIGFRVIAVMGLYFCLCTLLGTHDAWRETSADLYAAAEELITLLCLLPFYRAFGLLARRPTSGAMTN